MSKQQFDCSDSYEVNPISPGQIKIIYDMTSLEAKFLDDSLNVQSITVNKDEISPCVTQLLCTGKKQDTIQTKTYTASLEETRRRLIFRYDVLHATYRIVMTSDTGIYSFAIHAGLRLDPSRN